MGKIFLLLCWGLLQLTSAGFADEQKNEAVRAADQKMSITNPAVSTEEMRQKHAIVREEAQKLSTAQREIRIKMQEALKAGDQEAARQYQQQIKGLYDAYHQRLRESKIPSREDLLPDTKNFPDDLKNRFDADVNQRMESAPEGRGEVVDPQIGTLTVTDDNAAPKSKQNKDSKKKK